MKFAFQVKMDIILKESIQEKDESYQKPLPDGNELGTKLFHFLKFCFVDDTVCA